MKARMRGLPAGPVLGDQLRLEAAVVVAGDLDRQLSFKCLHL